MSTGRILMRSMNILDLVTLDAFIERCLGTNNGKGGSNGERGDHLWNFSDIVSSAC